MQLNEEQNFPVYLQLHSLTSAYSAKGTKLKSDKGDEYSFNAIRIRRCILLSSYEPRLCFVSNQNDFMISRTKCISSTPLIN